MEGHHMRKIYKRIVRDNPGNIEVSKTFGSRTILCAVKKINGEVLKVFVIDMREDYESARETERQLAEFAKNAMTQ